MNREEQLEQENHVLRDQVALLQEQRRVQHEQLSQQAEMLQQMQQQITSLQEQVNTLQERLSKDSHNSHLPPSSDRFKRQTKSLRRKSEKKPGAQLGHEGSSLPLCQTPDEVIRHEVATCLHCQADLRAIDLLSVERRQVLDVVPTLMRVQEHQAEVKSCPRCQHLTTASFPLEVAAPVQYGARLRAIAIYLSQQHLLPSARTCEILADVLGARVSEGSLAEWIARTTEQLAPVEAWIKEQLRHAEVLHQDETGLYVQGKRQWLHVSATKHLTHYQVHNKRGWEALEAIGLLTDFAGISVHDGWSSYWHYPGKHALCNVHHLRELTFVQEAYQHEWASEMKTLLVDLKMAVDEAREAGRNQLHPAELADWQTRFTEVLLLGEQTYPPTEEPIPKKAGRRKQHPARNLLERLSKYREEVLRFAVNFAVPFDNSQAERDIRMVKVQQKVSGGFRSRMGATAFCRIRGYLSSLRKQGAHLLNALQAAVLGHPLFPAF